MSEDEIVVNIKLLIKTGLSLEEYLILECVHKDYKKTLEDYVTKFGAIDRSVFISLNKAGYIKDFEGDIMFNKIKLTDKYYQVFGYVELDHDKFFKELRETYPKRVGGRSLHQDLSSCKKKYKQIVDSEETHRTILKCVKLYLLELQSGNRLQYIQLLPTWLNQRNFEQYYEEAISLDEVNKKEDTYNAI